MADVIVEGAAEDGVDQLRSAADAQDGNAVAEGMPNPFDFQGVPCRVEFDFGIDFTAVVLRADVVAATDHQCIRRLALPGMINRKALGHRTAQAQGQGRAPPGRRPATVVAGHSYAWFSIHRAILFTQAPRSTPSSGLSAVRKSLPSAWSEASSLASCSTQHQRSQEALRLHCGSSIWQLGNR